MRRKVIICTAVVVAMAVSIALLGLAGPLVVSLLLELAARKQKTIAR